MRCEVHMGMRVEVAHNVDPEPEEDLPLFEVWLEGYRYQLLHARNWRGDGDLTAEKIQALVSTVGEEIRTRPSSCWGLI